LVHLSSLESYQLESGVILKLRAIARLLIGLRMGIENRLRGGLATSCAERPRRAQEKCLVSHYVARRLWSLKENFVRVLEAQCTRLSPHDELVPCAATVRFICFLS